MVSHRDHHSVVVVIDNKAGVYGKRAVATLVQGLAWVRGCAGAGVNTGECGGCACVNTDEWVGRACGGRACMTYVWDYMNVGGDAGRDDVRKMRGTVQLGQMALETGRTH